MDLVQPGEELRFYRKGIIYLAQRAGAITAKGEYIEDWIGISETFNFHLLLIVY